MIVTKICPECKKEFQNEQWYFNKLERLKRKAFCSRSCSTRFTNKNRYEKRLMICEGCKKEFLVNESSQKSKYCSKDCYFKHDHDRLAELARKVGKESAEKISETKKEMFADGRLVHPWIGKKHTIQTKEKIRQAHNKYCETHDGYWKGKRLSEESKIKMSETRSKNWIDGKYDHIKMAWAQGHYFFKKANKKVWYRSSWELAFMKYLDNDDGVKNCTYEKIRIPYYRHENKRWYIVVFLVHYMDKTVMIEVKPFIMMYYPVNKLKFKAARQYCKERGIKFKVVTEKYLKHIGAM